VAAILTCKRITFENFKPNFLDIPLRFGIFSFFRANVSVELPFLGAGIAFMQLSVPKTKRSAAAPKGRGLL